MSFTLYNRYDGTFAATVLGTDVHAIVSQPDSGQYRVKEVKMDSDKKLVFVYDTVAET